MSDQGPGPSSDDPREPQRPPRALGVPPYSAPPQQHQLGYGWTPYGPTPPRPASSTPGWVWPVVVVAALVTGLVGGLLGGALVLGVSSSDSSLELDAGRPLPADNDSIAAVAARVLPSTVQVKVANGKGSQATGATGSGFVVDGRGHIITNNHVVEVADKDGVITVVDVEGRSRRATIVGRSPVYDLAVLQVRNSRGMRVAALGSSRRLTVGDSVVAIGSPLGLSATVTSGIVSAVDRPVTTGSGDASSYINAVQTDAAINPGNSGGPLVNLRGQVVGVNSAIATTGGMGTSGNIGVGFAIPMEQVRITANQILDTGEAEYPVIGADVRISDDSGLGATVQGVQAGTPAAEAGLQADDRIVAVGDHRVSDGISLIVAIRSHRPGETLTFTVVRDGQEQTVEMTLAAKVG